MPAANTETTGKATINSRSAMIRRGSVASHGRSRRFARRRAGTTRSRSIAALPLGAQARVLALELPRERLRHAGHGPQQEHPVAAQPAEAQALANQVVSGDLLGAGRAQPAHDPQQDASIDHREAGTVDRLAEAGV